MEQEWFVQVRSEQEWICTSPKLNQTREIPSSLSKTCPQTHASASADSWNLPWTWGMRRKEKSPTYCWTNLYKRALTSADRSNKATLPLTVPPCIQVICKGFTPAHIMITIRRQAALAFPQRQPSPPDVVYKPKALFKLLFYMRDQHHRL